MTPAPFHADLARGPEGGSAHWLTADDGLRLRIAVWPAPGARGTVLVFPGRTEMVEKYGRLAGDLAGAGYAALAVDWRGQGLADRLLRDPLIGHVGRFSDYQRDVAAVVGAAQALDLPRPWHLLAHSMGGCIGLRAVLEGLPVATAAFSAPMWDVIIPPRLRTAATLLSASARRLGLGHLPMPGTTRTSAIAATPFDGNPLTGDPDQYAAMVAQVAADPMFALGGPSMGWLHEALAEMRALRAAPAPRLPAWAAVGTREAIVEPAPIHARMANWSGGVSAVIADARHELLMETPAIRTRVLAAAVSLFDSGRAPDTR